MKETAGHTSASQMIEAANKIFSSNDLEQNFSAGRPGSFYFRSQRFCPRPGSTCGDDWGPGGFPIVQQFVEDNARHGRTAHTLAKSGYHTFKFWMVDPGVVLEKLVVNLDGVKPSYLGPPESYHHTLD